MEQKTEVLKTLPFNKNFMLKKENKGMGFSYSLLYRNGTDLLKGIKQNPRNFIATYFENGVMIAYDLKEKDSFIKNPAEKNERVRRVEFFDNFGNNNLTVTYNTLKDKFEINVYKEKIVVEIDGKSYVQAVKQMTLPPFAKKP